ncbi:hypothetical protein BOTBODRAFT_170132 [Botryobasidium botryosum FD-172 SS1]|uniref:CFEM domain-containing protein n=1 Tax=Botryobasidium botryosum (strain FD-172 SS1) TaxID=930990 RepID=A0A067N7K5_BOTB1|nr:hypothetical protein BOTBODRAFT_170132 [Botryobasidium botryosum FD-172 SS1]
MRAAFNLPILFAIFALAFGLDVRMLTPTITTAAPITTAGMPLCILKCSEAAAKEVGCVDVINNACVCNSQPFLNSSGLCIQTRCPELEGQAHQLLGTLCAGVPVTINLNFTTETAAPTGV